MTVHIQVTRCPGCCQFQSNYRNRQWAGSSSSWLVCERQLDISLHTGHGKPERWATAKRKTEISDVSRVALRTPEYFSPSDAWNLVKTPFLTRGFRSSDHGRTAPTGGGYRHTALTAHESESNSPSVKHQLNVLQLQEWISNASCAFDRRDRHNFNMLVN